MVLPAKTVVPITGRAAPLASVSVSGSWQGTATAKADAAGRWRCDLKTPESGGPFELTLRCGEDVRTVADVLVGDVWLASGQSNMEMQLGKAGWSEGVRDHEREVALATHAQLRVFTVKRRAEDQPTDQLEGEWVVCSPATAAAFSATAYFFARDLLAAGHQPLGVVVSAWGGTVAEAWTSEGALAAFPEFDQALAPRRAGAGAGGANPATRLERFWQAVASSPFAPDPVATSMPDLWSRGDLADFDGVVSYERDVQLTAAVRGRACWLELGAIDDMDTVWWNGERLDGHEQEGAWATPRRYRVPAERTAAATATLRVRVVDTGGEGGFTGRADELRLVAVDEPAAAIPLAGVWQRRVQCKLTDLPLWPAGGSPNRPAVLWNGMIAPLLPFPFTGAIWYQGESNRARPEQYARLFPAMIRDWRRAFARELPFYFVQIAPFQYEDEDKGSAHKTPLLREAQAAALSLPATGMVVTLDCGDAKDIHPTYKQPVGRRLAALAHSRHYGAAVTCTGPVFARAVGEDGLVRLSFTAVAGGMQMVNGGAGFELAGADGRFVAATARLDGTSVVVQAEGIAAAAFVRYAWAAVPRWSLLNGDGFPTPPFRAAIE